MANPQIPAGSATQPPMWAEAEYVVARRDAAMPDYCIKCGEPATGPKVPLTLVWSGKSMLGSPFRGGAAGRVGGVASYLAARQTATLQVALCPRHRLSRRTGLIVGAVAIVFGLGLMIFGWNDRTHVPKVIGILAIIVGALAPMATPQVIEADYIDDHYVRLKGVCPRLHDSLPTSAEPAPQ
jgi:hypothetical protein